jgi:hypothetical protein
MIFSKSEKLSIGMIHLLPIIGAPKFKSMDEVLNQAIADTEIICKTGFKGILVENLGDMPYYPTNVPQETIAGMTAIIQQVKTKVLRKYPEVKLGVNVLRNDAKAAIAIAKAVKADFVRVNVLHGAMVTDQGIIESNAHEVVRYQKNLRGKEVKVLADAQVKHAKRMVEFTLKEEIKDITGRSLADGIIISGERTGTAPSIEKIKEARKATHLPIIIGSGLALENMEEYIPIIEGYIVGSSLKEKKELERPISEKLAKEFMEKARKLS